MSTCSHSDTTLDSAPKLALYVGGVKKPKKITPPKAPREPWSPQIGVRLPTVLVLAVDEAARKARTTRSVMVRVLLARALGLDVEPRL